MTVATGEDRLQLGGYLTRTRTGTARKVSGERTKAAAVTKALQEFIARRRQKRLLDLVGTLEWNSEFDYKKERSRR